VIDLQLTEEQKKNVVEILAKYFTQNTVWVFGSRLHSKQVKPFSDLDLAIIGDTQFTADFLGRVAEDFSSSELPFKVDIAVFKNLPTQMQANIRKEHIVIF
jgi:predicted nucleotidyltransferase